MKNLVKHNSLLIVMLLHVSILQAQNLSTFNMGKHVIDAKSFDQKMEQMMAMVGVPGASIAFIDNSRIVYSKCYGRKTKDGKKINDRTLFEGASLSKSFLVFVAFRLVDQGYLNLDKPMVDYLEYEPLKHDSRYKIITPRMILSHSSGIENWKSENNRDTLEILYTPGEKYIYSGEGYNYLAKVISKLLSQSYEEYIQHYVIEPLNLKRTSLRYKPTPLNPFTTVTPTNYATGHNWYGKEYKKWTNREPVPSSANNFIASDYAKLILSTFDSKHLSSASRKQLVEPIVRMDDSEIFYGTGFELYKTNRDTIISHGGINPGYKSLAFYSTTTKRGLVLMTNSDRGDLMIKEINRLTTQFDIDAFFKNSFFEQFPAPSFSLLQTYLKKDTTALYQELQIMKDDQSLGPHTFDHLGYEICDLDLKASAKVLAMGMEFKPQNLVSCVLLALVNMDMGNYSKAYTLFQHAQEKKFDWWELKDDIKLCESKINESINANH